MTSVVSSERLDQTEAVTIELTSTPTVDEDYQPEAWPTLLLKRQPEGFLLYRADPRGNRSELSLESGYRSAADAWQWINQFNYLEEVLLLVGPGVMSVALESPVFDPNCWMVWRSDEAGFTEFVGKFRHRLSVMRAMKRILADGDSPVVASHFLAADAEWDVDEVVRTSEMSERPSGASASAPTFERTRYDVYAFDHEAKDWLPVRSGLVSDEAEATVTGWPDDSKTPMLWPAEWELTPAEHYGATAPTFEDAAEPRWTVSARTKGEEAGQCLLVTDLGPDVVADWMAEQNFGPDIEIDIRCSEVCRGTGAFSAPYGADTVGFFASEIEPLEEGESVEDQIDRAWDELFRAYRESREDEGPLPANSRALLRNMRRMLNELHERAVASDESKEGAIR